MTDFNVSIADMPSAEWLDALHMGIHGKTLSDFQSQSLPAGPMQATCLQGPQQPPVPLYHISPPLLPAGLDVFPGTVEIEGATAASSKRARNRLAQRKHRSCKMSSSFARNIGDQLTLTAVLRSAWETSPVLDCLRKHHQLEVRGQ